MERFGSGRGTYYRLAKRVYEVLGSVERYTRDRGIDETRQVELIRRHVNGFGEITNNMVQRICGINRNQAYRLLHKMVATGELKATGHGRQAKYVRA